MIAPVLGLIDSPAGSAGVMKWLYGSVPPDTTTGVMLQGWFVVHAAAPVDGPDVTGGTFTRIVKFALTAAPAASVAVTVADAAAVVEAVGVPLINPVAEATLNPAGNPFAE